MSLETFDLRFTRFIILLLAYWEKDYFFLQKIAVKKM